MAQSPTPTPNPHHIELHDRFLLYLQAAYSPLGIVSGSATSGILQWRDVPPEWGQGGLGYGRRFGSFAAQSGARALIQFGVSAVTKEDPRYTPSGLQGFRRRTAYAIAHAFIVPREDGSSGFAVSRVIGAYGSAAVADAWYPKPYAGAGDALVRGTIRLLGSPATTVFQEFWPDIRRKIFKRN